MAVPALLAVTLPIMSTVATATLLLLHLTLFPYVVFSGSTVAVSVVVSPSVSVSVLLLRRTSVIVILVSFLLTVIVQLAVFPFSLVAVDYGCSGALGCYLAHKVYCCYCHVTAAPLNTLSICCVLWKHCRYKSCCFSLCKRCTALIKTYLCDWYLFFAYCYCTACCLSVCTCCCGLPLFRLSLLLLFR